MASHHASKLIAHAAFEARLLLRPSHQRTVWAVNKLKCPIPDRPTLPPILSSRSYSDSTSTPTPPFPESSGSPSTPPFPKSSGSTEGPQSSGPEDKNWSHSKTWGKAWGWAKARATALGLGSIGGVRAGSFLCHLKHADYQRVLLYMPPSQSGEISTKHIGDMHT